MDQQRMTPAAGVVVIGAGQAGLSAGHHLARRGLTAADAAPSPRSVVILDANPAPGGAWQHRWESLRMETVNGIFGLPGAPTPPFDPAASSRDAVPAYFRDFEEREHLPIHRPVTVTAVRRADADPHGDLLVESSEGTWRTRAIINATGTWNTPVIPQMPGQDTFEGRQLHSREYISLEDFAGQRVAIVGGGISAIQLLEEISRVATVLWYTRREPVFREGPFRPEVEGREVIAKVTERIEAGEPPASVVSSTGLTWSPYALAAKERGVLVRRPLFTRILPHGLVEADGTTTTVDAILWATGYVPDLRHLEPLHLRDERGGIAMRGTRVLSEPRVHLIGYGPSQSTVGANRAGRDAARAIDRLLEAPPTTR